MSNTTFIQEEIEALLAEARLPRVLDFRVRVGLDSRGEDAAYIYLIIPDGEVHKSDFVNASWELDKRVTEIVQSVDEDIYPYVRFRSISEPPPFAS